MKSANSRNDLNHELDRLRQENQALSAQLAFHRKVFRELHETLGAADELGEASRKNEAVQQLLQENEQLKNQLKFSRLSEREREVLKYIVHGYTSREIATQLGISKLTVDTHRKHIQQKMEVSNVAELIRAAVGLELA